MAQMCQKNCKTSVGWLNEGMYETNDSVINTLVTRGRDIHTHNTTQMTYFLAPDQTGISRDIDKEPLKSTNSSTFSIITIRTLRTKKRNAPKTYLSNLQLKYANILLL